MKNKHMEEKIQEFKNNNNIVDIAFRYGIRVNNTGRCSCPWHGEDKNPSMQLYRRTNTFKCFTCGKQGDVIDFIQLLTNKSLYEILEVMEYISSEKKLEEFIMNNYKCIDDASYKYNRVHFYKDKNENIISAKVVFKNIKGDKKITQFNIENNFRPIKGKVDHSLIFNYPNVIRAVETGKEIIIVEGEKDAEMLIKQGYTATTTRYGASTLKDDEIKCLENSRLIIIGDNDEVGRDYVDNIKKKLLQRVKSLKVVELPGLYEKEDVTDWFNKGHNKHELNKIIHDTIDVKLKEEIEKYDFSDIGLITRFRDSYKENVKYCMDTNQIIYWENERWNLSYNKNKIMELSMNFIKELEDKLLKYVNYKNDKHEIKLINKIIKDLKKEKTVKMLANMYTGDSSTDILRTEFDTDMRYINCKNVIIDTHTGEILNKSRDIKLTKYIDIEYEKGKENILFKESVRRLLGYNNEEIDAFETLLGYMLSGKANQKILPIITGARNTGKTQMFELIKSIFGEQYVKAINKSSLIKAWDTSRGHNSEVASLLGARMVLCTETTDTDYLSGDIIKKLVGGDTLVARCLYKDVISFIPTFVPIIFTNYKPRFDANDDAMILRVLPIDVVNPLSGDEVNPNFKEEVLKDKEGLFSYLIDCIIKYNSLGKIVVPERWQKTKDSYSCDNNPFKSFHDNYLMVEEGNSILSDDVYRTFLNWYSENCGDENISKAKFTKELKKLGVNNFASNGKTKYKDLVFKNYNYALEEPKQNIRAI